MDAFPDLDRTDDDELERLLRVAEADEDEISVRRRLLHTRIDALREERVRRLRLQVDAGSLEPHVPASLDRPIFEGTGAVPEEHGEERAVDVASLGDDELRNAIVALEREEDDVSLRRRMLHGRIDILRAERERRRRGLHVDPEGLGPILGGAPR